MKIVITDGATLSGGGVSLERFSRYGEVCAYDLTAPKQLAERLADAEVLLCNKTPVPAEIFDKCPKLRYIGECATGYNNIDIAAAKAHGVTVCNAGVYSTNAVAQHTFALILHHYSCVAAYDAAVRDGVWKRAKTFSVMPYPMEELSGKILAVVGLGSIGRKVAAIGAAFGMHVIAATRTTPRDCPYDLVSVDEAFARADVLTLHTPLTEQTAHMVNRRRLETMKPTALLVNTARGGLINEDDLAWALQNGMIAGAALDVLTEEPMGDTPLYGLENCTITPHVAWTPLETRQRLLSIVEDNLRLYLAGTPQNVIC
ncbi:D-2-hydroxyacid dehydrogenase [uncultured Ruminococcus sp.]|uniref:D-2-hydroxyacid dehydrogenase n=1 Tax=uncultured Ruminococcus sp. TaxID=165186 RepID=UPI002627B6BF|nr:D-2-hydroxyacid dehydrogenase [uncultured Ruminococcus sp.]